MYMVVSYEQRNGAYIHYLIKLNMIAIIKLLRNSFIHSRFKCSLINYF